MPQLPESLLAYWNGLGTLPPLFYEYAPQSAALPLAVFAPSGFSREYKNEYLRLDTYQYEFVILGTNCESVYTAGFSAVTQLNDFDYTGLIQITPEPEAMATPTRSEPGYKTQWEYKFTVNFLLQPII
jgi:hypothetical protein